MIATTVIKSSTQKAVYNNYNQYKQWQHLLQEVIALTNANIDNNDSTKHEQNQSLDNKCDNNRHLRHHHHHNHQHQHQQEQEQEQQHQPNAAGALERQVLADPIRDIAGRALAQVERLDYLYSTQLAAAVIVMMMDVTLWRRRLRRRRRRRCWLQL